MDSVTMESIKKTFLSQYSGGCVSLLMPTHRAGRETEQDPIRFKNSLKEAQERLLTVGLRSLEVREMLKAPQRLLENPRFWHHQSYGLAVYFSTDHFEFFPLQNCW